jgi:hypothetical protein
MSASTEKEKSEDQAPLSGNPASKEEPLTFWQVLNSQFTLWLLGVLLVSFVPWSWNYWAGRRAKEEQERQQKIDEQKRAEQQRLEEQRQDSQFLATLLPYLTASDLKAELRAVRVIQSRYPGEQTPAYTQKLIADVLQDAATIPQNQQNEETRRLVTSVFRGADITNPLRDEGATAKVKQLPARVYLQIFGEDQRRMANSIQSRLVEKGFIVPGIENVEGWAQGVTTTEVRFFHDSDGQTAKNIADLLSQNGVKAFAPPMSHRKANTGAIEVWFAPKK